MSAEQMKYAGIRERGEVAIHEGNIPLFTTPVALLQGRFNVSAELDGGEIAQNLLIDPLQEIESATGVKYIIAGRDFRFHTTIQEGEYQGDPNNEAEREALYDEIARNAQLQTVVAQLKGQYYWFDHLLPDRGNVLLACGNIPNWVKEARTEISAVYQQYGLKVLSMADIMHSSLARIVELPTGGLEAGTYLNAIDKMRSPIAERVPGFRARSVYHANPLALMDRPVS